MPELPEVETIRRELESQVQGRIITKVKILRDRCVQGEKNHFCKNLKDKRITELQRRGKYLIFKLEPKGFVVSHLKMTGKFVVDKARAKSDDSRYDRVLLFLDNGQKLVFSDVRCFGYLSFEEQLEDNKSLNILGLDPWDKKLTGAWLKKEFANRRLNIKSTLLNQQIIAGIGNIYASEILFRSGIHPEKPAMDLEVAQLTRIIRNTRKVLTEALEHNGTSISDYRRVDDKQGEFQNFLRVYERAGEKCRKCSEKIIKIKQNQRSTYLCPQCQPV